jgi:hypothetical protein
MFRAISSGPRRKYQSVPEKTDWFTFRRPDSADRHAAAGDGRDLADRLAGLAKAGHRAALFEGEVVILFAHGNTLAWCCTSFVSLGDLQDRRKGPSLRSG